MTAFPALRALSLAALLALGVVPATSACAPATEEEADLEANEDAITDVAQTEVKGQVASNCWIYSTAGWIESMHKRASGQDVDVSEPYFTYVHLYSQIVGLQSPISPGGSFKRIAPMLSGWGFMHQKDFVMESWNEAKAWNAVVELLTKGALKKKKARSNRVLVRDELDRAFHLSASTSAALDEAFRHDMSQDFVWGQHPIPPRFVHRISELGAVLKNPETGQLDRVTVQDALGTPEAWMPFGPHKGKYMWHEVLFPGKAGHREFEKRIQRALHDGNPVQMTWNVAFRYSGSGTFKLSNDGSEWSGQGSHMSVIDDYQVAIPGIGVLEAGVVETRPEMLAAALRDDAEIEFIRIKNSWGAGAPGPEDIRPAGYYDIYSDYLLGPFKWNNGNSMVSGWASVLLPAGY